MGRYTHLALAEREEIVLLRRGGSCGGMAGAAGGDEAAVSREMAGNSFAVGSGRCHRASAAQRGCESRRGSCVRPGVLDGERGAGLVRRLVVREHWSPGRIAGGIAVERPGLMVFASAIYRAINERRLDPPGLTRARRGIRARLRHKGKRRHGRGGPEERRGEIPGARPIGQRPEIVGERSGLGGREGDAVVGKGAGACLVTLVDRRSGLLSGGRCAAHARRDVADVGIGALRRHPESRTVTLDRGMGFADFEKVVQATGAVFCFALPRHPWRRGGNGNTDGLIREYLPKGADFTTVGEQEVRAVYDAIDHRPRKRHGYRTPWEVHHSTVLHLL